MATVKNPKASDIFTCEKAIKMYNEFINNKFRVIEHGIDEKGQIYFKSLNGCTTEIERFTRQEFLKLSEQNLSLKQMEKGWVKLTDGKFLLKDFGKYKSDLLIISDRPDINYQKISPQEFNLEEGDLTFIRGAFFVTKKGANAFRIEEKGKHLLVRDDWGGAFNQYRGRSLFELENILFKRRATSNGGGMGYDYVVVPEGTKYEISLEDL